MVYPDFSFADDKTRFVIADKFIFVQIAKLAIVFQTIIGVSANFVDDIFALAFNPLERGRGIDNNRPLLRRFRNSNK